MKEVKNNYKSIPNCLRKLRRICGYSQQQVAAIMGVRNAAMISRWENGSRFPKPLSMLRLSVIYSTTPNAMYVDLMRVLRHEVERRKERTAVTKRGIVKVSF